MKCGDFLDGRLSLKVCSQHACCSILFLNCVFLVLFPTRLPFLGGLSNLSKASVTAARQLPAVSLNSVWLLTIGLLPFSVFMCLAQISAQERSEAFIDSPCVKPIQTSCKSPQMLSLSFVCCALWKWPLLFCLFHAACSGAADSLPLCDISI